MGCFGDYYDGKSEDVTLYQPTSTAKNGGLKFQSISQKAAIRSFCFSLDSAIGAPIKRAEKMSQTRPDKNEKKV